MIEVVCLFNRTNFSLGLVFCSIHWSKLSMALLPPFNKDRTFLHFVVPLHLLFTKATLRMMTLPNYVVSSCIANDAGGGLKGIVSHRKFA